MNPFKSNLLNTGSSSDNKDDLPPPSSDLSKSVENNILSILCNQGAFLLTTKEPSTILHFVIKLKSTFDGFYLQPGPWEDHHLHCHHLQPGMGGDLHDYAVRRRSENLPNTRKSVPARDLSKSVKSH